MTTLKNTLFCNFPFLGSQGMMTIMQAKTQKLLKKVYQFVRKNRKGNLLTVDFRTRGLSNKGVIQVCKGDYQLYWGIGNFQEMRGKLLGIKQRQSPLIVNVLGIQRIQITQQEVVQRQILNLLTSLQGKVQTNFFLIKEQTPLLKKLQTSCRVLLQLVDFGPQVLRIELMSKRQQFYTKQESVSLSSEQWKRDRVERVVEEKKERMQKQLQEDIMSYLKQQEREVLVDQEQPQDDDLDV